MLAVLLISPDSPPGSTGVVLNPAVLVGKSIRQLLAETQLAVLTSTWRKAFLRVHAGLLVVSYRSGLLAVGGGDGRRGGRAGGPGCRGCVGHGRHDRRGAPSLFGDRPWHNDSLKAIFWSLLHAGSPKLASRSSPPCGRHASGTSKKQEACSLSSVQKLEKAKHPKCPKWH